MLNYMISWIPLRQLRLIVLCEFNHLQYDINKLNRIFKLKQIVSFATKGPNKLNLIPTGRLQETHKAS